MRDHILCLEHNRLFRCPYRVLPKRPNYSSYRCFRCAVCFLYRGYLPLGQFSGGQIQYRTFAFSAINWRRAAQVLHLQSNLDRDQVQQVEAAA